jgi:hypothetical protein
MVLRSIYRSRAAAFLAAALPLALAIGGCTSDSKENATPAAATPADLATPAVHSMNTVKQEAVNARMLVDDTMNTVNTMQTSDDLRSTFTRFSQQVDQVEAQSEKLKGLTTDMKNRVQAYIKQWQTEMTKVEDPSLVQISDQRRIAVQKRYHDVQAQQQAFNDAYSTFYTDLTSLRTYLGTDLTNTSVKAAEPSVKKANEDRAALKAKADTLLKTLKEIAAGISTPPPQ